jgi:hypothetical protein
MRSLLLGMIGIVIGSDQSFAIDGGRATTFNPIAAGTCGAFIEVVGDERAARGRDRTPEPDGAYTDFYLLTYEWLKGFLTAYNVQTPNNKINVLPGNDMKAALKGLFFALEKHCQEQPMSDFTTAVMTVIKKLDQPSTN